VGVGEGADELTALQASIEAALVQTGLYRAEERPFTPHVTLGRARTPGDFSAVVESHARWSGAGFDVTEVLVMSSELRPEGPEHAVLGRVPL
jgi:2'-5' RNA ligase